MPRISVVVPVYKVERYLQKCVDSILSQTYKDFELILVDDGSPDNCPAICDEYAAKDKCVHVIHQKNGGLSAARNAGIDWAFANSDSEWITFIDSDDWVHPDMINCLYSSALANAHNLTVCAFFETNNHEEFKHIDSCNHLVLTPEEFFLTKRVNAIVAWGKLYKKTLFKDIRYPVGKIHEDEFVTYKHLFANEFISYISEPLYFYRKNENSITNTPWTLNRLQGFEAQYEQLLYFKANNYSNIINVCVPSYLYSILQHKKIIDSANVSSDTKIAADKILKKYHRKTLIKFRKIVPFNKYKYFYEYAFPKTMQFLYLLNATYQKIKNVFLK